ncbi:hypothetical protein D9M71_105860 [compost metagenome]
MHFLVGLATGCNVGVETAAAKNQVGNEGEEGNEQQRQCPGNCPLSGAYGQHSMESGDHPKQLNQPDQIAKKIWAVVIHTQVSSLWFDP